MITTRLRLALTVALAALAATGCTKDLVCSTGELACAGVCVSPDRDPTNCGACGHACGALQVCNAGSCDTCAEGATACGSACVDLTIDAQNCGTCGTACGGATPLCAGAGAGCVSACPGGTTQCGASCPDLLVNTTHCGACNHACAPGQRCIDGICAANLYAACYWTGEVKPLTRALGYGGPTISLGAARPMRLGLAGTTLLAAAGQPQASLSFASVSGTTFSQRVQLPGTDLEGISIVPGAALVTNATVGTLEVVSLDGTVLDEIPMPDQQSFPNPLGVAVTGTSAYVALNALQKVAHVDLSGLAACEADAAPPACVDGACGPGRRCIGGVCRLACGEVANVIDLSTVPGAKDGSALPLPSAVAAANGKIYVSLSNLEWSTVTCDGFTYEWWARPAGPGRLVEIDPANADTVSIVNLGAGCKSPSDVVLHGSTLWVSCGAYCFSDLAPGAVLPVDLSGGTPVVGTPIALGATVGGSLALCGSYGYVTDQRKTGAVVRFDPSLATTSAPATVCGADAYANALVSDLLCFR